MKVKEVYHYLTVLSSWEDDVNSAMNNKMLLVRTLENHKKNAVFATEQDEKREIVDMQVHYTFDELVKMWETIINEKEKIYDLIEKKKVEYGVPDTIFTMSKSYRRLMNALKAASRQSKQSVITQKGTGFIKSGEGVGEDGTGFGNRGAIDRLGKALGKAAGGNKGGFVAGAYCSGAVKGYVGCSKVLDTQLVDIKGVIIVGIIVDANVFGVIWQSDGDLTGR